MDVVVRPDPPDDPIPKRAGPDKAIQLGRDLRMGKGAVVHPWRRRYSVDDDEEDVEGSKDRDEVVGEATLRHQLRIREAWAGMAVKAFENP